MSDSSPPRPASATERQLREALEVLAEGVCPAPHAYRDAHRDWLRRERRRSMVLAALISLLITVTTLVGLWLFDRIPARSGALFKGVTLTRQHDASGTTAPERPPTTCAGPRRPPHRTRSPAEASALTIRRASACCAGTPGPTASIRPPSRPP